MHFLKSITIATLAASSVIALPQVPAVTGAPPGPGTPAAPRPATPYIPIPGPPNDKLRTITNDLLILTRAAAKGMDNINTVLDTGMQSTSAEINAKVNTNLAAIQKAALQAGYGVAGDVADAAKEITAPEAKALKSDAQLFFSTASNLAAIIKKATDAQVSSTNTELDGEKAALVSALEGIQGPLTQYIMATKATGASGSAEAVVDLQATVAGLVSNMKSAFGMP